MKQILGLLESLVLGAFLAASPLVKSPSQNARSAIQFSSDKFGEVSVTYPSINLSTEKGWIKISYSKTNFNKSIALEMPVSDEIVSKEINYLNLMTIRLAGGSVWTLYDFIDNGKIDAVEISDQFGDDLYLDSIHSISGKYILEAGQKLFDRYKNRIPYAGKVSA